METPNSEVHVHGIQCDNPECSYVDMTVKVEDYKDWVNKPCPLCGENLLTEEAHLQVVALLEASEYINSLSPQELENIMSSATEADINATLDFINETGLKKVETLPDGREHWSTDNKLKNERPSTGNKAGNSLE